jgi:hypothetical protein
MGVLLKVMRKNLVVCQLYPIGFNQRNKTTSQYDASLISLETLIVHEKKCSKGNDRQAFALRKNRKIIGK